MNNTLLSLTPTVFPNELGTVTLAVPFKRTALITGINGQDGSYMAELLLHYGYKVYGIVRRASTDNLGRIHHILNKIELFEGHVEDSAFVTNLISKLRPQEIYNFAAQSHVKTSFDCPHYTYSVNTLGLMNILQALVSLGMTYCRVYQASSSEMYGSAPAPQGMDTKFMPISPYACSKLAAHELVNFYRQAYSLHVVSGILFNHESPRRGENFVTRKITKYFTDPIGNYELQGKLKLGNIDACRDWGFAPEYIQCIYGVMQDTKPHDFVLGTGKSISVRQFLDIVGDYTDLDWTEYVEFNTAGNVRQTDIPKLQANPTHTPGVDVSRLVEIMVDHDAFQPDPLYLDVKSYGYEYYMENFGQIFAWRVDD